MLEKLFLLCEDCYQSADFWLVSEAIDPLPHGTFSSSEVANKVSHVAKTNVVCALMHKSSAKWSIEGHDSLRNSANWAARLVWELACNWGVQHSITELALVLILMACYRIFPLQLLNNIMQLDSFHRKCSQTWNLNKLNPYKLR